MYAYDKIYLLDAMENLGEATDCAAHLLNVELNAFWSAFTASEYSSAFQIGSPRVISGMSGVDLALRIAEESGLGNSKSLAEKVHTSSADYCLSCEYWCGWIIAYYQWSSARTFKDIARLLPMSDVQRMYPTFHEESEERFVEAASAMEQQRKSKSNLSRQRQIMGLSQSQLARKSGVGIRAIQQYEQGVKNINNASASKIASLARALNCEIEELFEPASYYEYASIEI